MERREYWVEYNRLEDGRPTEICCCQRREVAEEYAKDFPDAEIVEVIIKM